MAMFVPQDKVKQCSLTLYDYLKLHAKANGGKPYFITETETLTYAQAYSVVNGLANSFEELGIERYKISVVYAVPSFFLRLLRDEAHKRYDLKSLR